jgi:hypothetical protein
MHGPINVKFPNNTSKWQMGFNSAFKGLRITGGIRPVSYMPSWRTQEELYVIFLRFVQSFGFWQTLVQLDERHLHYSSVAKQTCTFHSDLAALFQFLFDKWWISIHPVNYMFARSRQCILVRSSWIISTAPHPISSRSVLILIPQSPPRHLK